MTAYFIRRLLLVIPTFIGITIMVFFITRFVPGGPIERIIAETRAMQMGGQGSVSTRAGPGEGQPFPRNRSKNLKPITDLTSRSCTVTWPGWARCLREIWDAPPGIMIRCGK